MVILVLIGTVLVIISEIFHGRVSLNSVEPTLLLLMNFLRAFCVISSPCWIFTLLFTDICCGYRSLSWEGSPIFKTSLFFPWIHFVKNFHRFAFWNLNQLIIHTWINFGIIHFCCSFREYSQPAFIYLFKVNNGNTEITCETRSKLKNKDTRATSKTSFWCLHC